jgi:hypothetical protein
MIENIFEYYLINGTPVLLIFGFGVTGGVVLNVLMSILTKPQMDKMIAKPTIPHNIELLAFVLASSSPDFMRNMTIFQIINMTARAMRRYMTTLLMSINFCVREFASVTRLVCAKASIGEDVNKTVRKVFFIFN